jgi:hypothetical protein
MTVLLVRTTIRSNLWRHDRFASVALLLSGVSLTTVGFSVTRIIERSLWIAFLICLAFGMHRLNRQLRRHPT